MATKILSRMSGEELFLLRMIQGVEFAPLIDAELDRRAMHGWQKPRARRLRATSDANLTNAVA